MDEGADNGFNHSQTKMSMTTKTPLSAIAKAFEELSGFLGSQTKDQKLRLDNFCEACSLVSVLFSCLGLAFKFAEMEYVAKVHDLVEASKTYATLENVLDRDVANDTVKKPGSHSRNLRRVRQGLDLIRALFEEFLSTEMQLQQLILKCVHHTTHGQSGLRFLLECILFQQGKNFYRSSMKQIIQQRRK
ncbi:hypothetical protein E1A91_A03G115900v1 [Gossypium mustelinum]|uniref:Glycolipid transfer protein domain-containing protein n=1 Tax=Gossypium mustelinum TaxID=34275 RepID=A0A5D2ZUY4_GOSMU|nr:hypothetical protein E1A91_A03G115900v1 [Gossypium mustelinum]